MYLGNTDFHVARTDRQGRRANLWCVDWARVEPVLKACYAALDSQPFGVSGSDVVPLIEPAMDPQGAGQAMLLLDNAGYINCQFVNQSPVPVIVEPTEKGLQLASRWPGGPSASYDERLIAIIDQLLASGELGEASRGKLVRLREAVTGAGQSIISEVIARLIEHKTGI